MIGEETKIGPGRNDINTNKLCDSGILIVEVVRKIEVTKVVNK